MFITAIVMGYGIYADNQPAYRKYLESIVADLKKRGIKDVVLCGGKTNKNHPTLSEAESIKPFFADFDISLETETYTTAGNLSFSQKLLRTPCHKIIYCDSIRSPKVFYLALTLFYPEMSPEDKYRQFIDFYFLHQDYTQQVSLSYRDFEVVGIPMSDTMKMAANQILASILEIQFLEHPDLHQEFVARRKTEWGIK